MEKARVLLLQVFFRLFHLLNDEILALILIIFANLDIFFSSPIFHDHLHCFFCFAHKLNLPDSLSELNRTPRAFPAFHLTYKTNS